MNICVQINTQTAAAGKRIGLNGAIFIRIAIRKVKFAIAFFSLGICLFWGGFRFHFICGTWKLQFAGRALCGAILVVK